MKKNKLRFALPEIIERKGIKVGKLSKSVGLSRQTIYSLLSNHSVAIQYETIEKLCNGLNITPAELFVMESTAAKS